jgi:uncharacterized protein (DUF433 family)
MAITDLLTEAFKQASMLPAAEQDQLARSLLQELAGDKRWELLLENSQDMLEAMANQALQDHREGKTKAMGFAEVEILPNALEPMSTNLMDRITINPEQCGGRPCIRGMRIRIVDVLDLLAEGLTPEQILDELPDLEAEDIRAVLIYAARHFNHPVHPA